MKTYKDFKDTGTFTKTAENTKHGMHKFLLCEIIYINFVPSKAFHRTKSQPCLLCLTQRCGLVPTSPLIASVTVLHFVLEVSHYIGSLLLLTPVSLMPSCHY